MDSLNETTKKLRTILLGMITRQLKTNSCTDNRVNLYMVEVQFIKDVIITIAGSDVKDNDNLHDWACDIVNKIHKEFKL